MALALDRIYDRTMADSITGDLFKAKTITDDEVNALAHLYGLAEGPEREQ